MTNKKAEEYRQLAKECKEVAERMSLRSDRERMLAMAERWSELAREVDGKRNTHK